MRQAGYKDRYVHTWAYKVWEKIGVKNAIAKKTREFREKCKLTPELQTQRITDNYLRSKEKDDRKTELTALDMLNRGIGYYNADESGKMASKPAQINIEELKMVIMANQIPEFDGDLGIAGSNQEHVIEDNDT